MLYLVLDVKKQSLMLLIIKDKYKLIFIHKKVSEILKEPAGFCIPLLGVDASNFRVIFPK